jgi:hypothetical protein
MAVKFAPATRAAAKARIALAGPSGSGKTYTGLSLACRLAERVAVIDTERGSASKYAGLNGWKFDTLAPDSFSPQSLTDALAVAAGEGYGCVLVDSLSHYWMGVDGMLEQVDRKTSASRSTASFSSGWKDMAPIERRMLDALVSYPGHVIATLRVKTEYVIEQNDRGKSVPRKVGLKPIQREGLEYEFDVIGDLDLDNLLTVSKTRIPMLHGATIPKPGPELAETIRDWLADGEETVGPLAYRADALDVDATVASLRDLLGRVRTAGLTNAPVVDDNGNPTVLGDLIVSRGKALAAAVPQDEPAPPPPAAEAAPPQQRTNGTKKQAEPAAQDTPPAAPKTPAEARAQLRATCAENGWDLDIVAARFESDHHVELKKCTDRDLIVRFRASLFSVSDSALRAPAEAGAR